MGLLPWTLGTTVSKSRAAFFSQDDGMTISNRWSDTVLGNVWPSNRKTKTNCTYGLKYSLNSSTIDENGKLLLLLDTLCRPVLVGWLEFDELFLDYTRNKRKRTKQLYDKLR